MHIDENWAVTTARARAFFDAQPDVIACADGFVFVAAIARFS